MTNINNNLPPIEEIREIKEKNQVPSFAEFMQSYETNSNLNYDDLSGGDVGTPKGYGPCRNSDCGCYCASYECVCSNQDYERYGAGLSKTKRIVNVGGAEYDVKGFQHLIHTINDRTEGYEFPIETKRAEWGESQSIYSEGGRRNGGVNFGTVSTSAGASRGMGGAIVGGGASASALELNDGYVGAKFFSASAGGEIGAGLGGVTAGYSANADLVNIKLGGVRANLGGDVGSGVTIGAGGVEAKVAGLGFSVGKKMGISTPFGGASVDLEESCIIQ